MSQHAAYTLPDALFIQRDEELEQLGARCEDHPLVTLIGEPGVGKSTLVSRLTHARGPIARLDLDAIDLAQTPDLHAHLLGLLARDGAPLADLAALDARLVVFDNADRLIPALQAVIRTWRQDAPALHILITARQPTQLPDEQLVRLEPMRPEAAHALFMLHAARAGAAPQPDTAQHAIQRLLRELDGNPLAIALAASRLRSLTAAQLVERISARIDLLRRAASAGERFDSLRAAFEDAWQELSPPQRALYLAASIFQSGFTLEALEAVVDADEVPDALDVLESLLERSLIRRVPSRRETARYALPNGLRRWASAQLDEAPAAREAARGRHLAHFAALAQRAEVLLQAERLAEATALLDEELDNLIAAWQHARLGGYPQAQTLRALFDRIASARQHTTGVLTLLGACLDLSLSAPEDAQRHALRLQQRAEQLIRAGQTAAALRELDQATRLLDAHQAPDLSAALHQTMAAVHIRAGQLDAARYHYERALGSVGEDARPRILVRLGRVALNMGDHPRAQEALQEALTTLRAGVGVDEPELSEARILSYLAALRLAQGRMEETRRLSQEALAASRVKPDPKLELTLREQLGLVAHELGDLIDAARHYQLATEAAAQARQPQPFTLALRLGHLALDHRQPQQALAHMEPVLRDPQAREVPLAYGLASLGCGLAQLMLDRPAHANDLFEQATARFQQLRLHTLDGLTCAFQAICAAHLPDTPRAQELLALARARLGLPTMWMEQTLQLIAALCAAIHDDTRRALLSQASDRAQELVEQACDRFDPSPHGITDARLRFIIELAQQRASRNSAADTNTDANTDANADALIVAEQAAWFRLPGQTCAVELRRKRVLRRLLEGLAAQRVTAPGAVLTSEQLIALGWPDERFILNDSAHNRLYVALNRLRTEGLEALLQTERDGYRLDPRVPIKRVDD